MGKNLKKKIKRSRKRTYKRRIYKRTRSRTRKRSRTGPRTRTRKKRSYKGGSKSNAYFDALKGIEHGDGERKKKPPRKAQLDTNNYGLGRCRAGAPAVEPYNERYNHPNQEPEPAPSGAFVLAATQDAVADMAELEQPLVALAAARAEVRAMGGIASAPVAPQQPGPMTLAQLEADFGRCFSAAEVRPLSPGFDGPIEVEVPRGGVKKGDMIVQDLGKYGPRGEGLVALVVAEYNYAGEGDEQTFATYR